MTSITVIGTGNMGQAITALAEKGGNTVQSLGSKDTDQAVTGDIVVLAVPYAALSEIAATRGEELAGRTVVDITNPLNFQTGELAVAPDSSAAAELAAALPSSKVLKAFNTNFGPTLAMGTVGGSQTTTVLIAGDDADAKTQLADVVTAGGLQAVDAGPLGRARELEGIGLLQIGLAMGEKIGWTGGLALIK